MRLHPVNVQTPCENPGPGVLPPLRRNIAFGTMIVAIGAVVMDNVAAALALPTIARHFSVSDAQSIWVVNVYQLVLIICILPMAALADKVGYRRVYIAGLATFAITAMFSALAPTFELLIASRAIQGVATACVMSVNLALIRTIFPENRLGSALGMNATAGAIATAAGPSIAGFLIEYASWQWIFAIGIPFTATAALVSYFAQPPSPKRNVRLDLLSALLSALTFGGLLMGISAMGHHWPVAVSLVLLTTGMLAGLALVHRLRDVADPLVPIDLLAIPPFAMSVLASMLTFTAQMIAFVSLPFHMQTTLGFSAVDAGLAFSGWPLALACTAPVAGVLADRMSQGLLSGIGLSILTLGLGLLALLGADASQFDVALRLAMCGVGFALFQTPNNRIMLGSSPRSRASAASGALGTARLLGQALGTALATLAITTNVGGNAAFALWGAAGLALLGASVSLLRRRFPRT